MHMQEKDIKRVLVLLSSYQGERYIAEQLDSLLGQSYQALDIVVRDDCSTDATRSILHDYEQKSGHITVIEGDNVGCARSFWLLLQYAKAHLEDYAYFAFCDQDDYWLEDKVSRAVAQLEQAQEEGPCLYCSNLTYTDAELHTLGLKRQGLPETTNKAKSLVESFATGCTMVFNRALLQVATSYDVQRLHLHDLWLFHSCMFLGKIIYDPQPYILYRQHRNNEIGAKSTFIQRLHSKMKSFKTLKTQHFREIEAQELLKAYDTLLSVDDRKLISFVATYRQHWWLRLSWLLGLPHAPKGIRMTRATDQFFLMIRILIGKV